MEGFYAKKIKNKKPSNADIVFYNSNFSNVLDGNFIFEK